MKTDIDFYNRMLQTHSNLKSALMTGYNSEGYWTGRLSSSALATAVACFALHVVDCEKYSETIRNGLSWIARNANEDGGWGDCPGNVSNMSTTILCWCVFSQIKTDGFTELENACSDAEKWLLLHIKSLSPEQIRKSVLDHYGTDQTFSVPILTVCALSGRLGKLPGAWKYIPQLPLELAALPAKLYKWIGLPVVSYALPALIAIGMVRHRQKPCYFNPLWYIRIAVEKKLLRKLVSVQPVNGGFLEAAPLTAFVVASLAAAGLKNHETVLHGVDFLLQSVRDDGSWSIDTNLSTWVTTLSVNTGIPMSEYQKARISDFIIKQQFTKIHPYTQSRPGGWGWTNLPGAVPDADDTSGAILTLWNLQPENEKAKTAATEGINWLMELTNNDGGIPTFCKGWGKLPFDKSCPDITAHSLRAMISWRDAVDSETKNKIDKTIAKFIKYLKNNQQANGSWFPLWFGNQLHPAHKNPVYGTSLVVISLNTVAASGKYNVAEMKNKAVKWIINNQNKDNGWGGFKGLVSTVEETALALSALVSTNYQEEIKAGMNFLMEYTKEGTELIPSPIGLYFSSLWYYENFYPLVYFISALERLKAKMENT